MSIAADTHQPAVSAAILSADPWSPAVMPTTFLTTSDTAEIRLLLGIPDFDLYLAAPIRDLAAAEDYSEVIIKAFIDAGVSARVTLKNEAAASRDDPIKIKEASLNFDVVASRPRAHFISDSLYAVLTLARTATATVSMCGYTVLKHVSENFGSNVDKIFGAAYTSAFKQEIPKKICCDKFREAARTGSPCDPRTDLDCDGKTNQTDVATSSFPVIDVFTRAANAPIDPFPFKFNLFDPDFSPNSAARGSKGVGDCACKWELIKGELKCNGVVDENGNKQHVYTATWRCPSTKAEVFTTKYAPSTAPCP